MSVYGFDLGN